MLDISFEGRARIFFDLMAKAESISMDVLKATILARYHNGYVPGIVRRGDISAYGEVNVGFVYPWRVSDSRLRIANIVYPNEILGVISPYILPYCEYQVESRCMAALKDVSLLLEAQKGHIGVIGSAALEIVTGYCYTDGNSDLDLIIQGQTLCDLTETYTVLAQIGQKHRVKIDAEVQLRNGYGIKADELFIGSQTLLGKSLCDVRLFNRENIIETLNSQEEFTWKLSQESQEKS
ncbi:phosphoribosyl-dephospho-CoA transferase MdcG domain-containing protein [Cloacibacillus sp. An23]|uniref:phosphoribosyl-dephospho-CoA transferase MdcG domain-containing protein n=1 Tax=Cloacibacillus sp. An23 TaxID=1965591 RepID=UPI0013027A2B|nr:phosphoribosyl-dephospho-CoA transferase MdcG domain-containing protein [Cloacibacillus sp. An23]